MKEILEHKIKIYEFPKTEEEEEMKLVRKIKVSLEGNAAPVSCRCVLGSSSSLQDRLPLAVVGSNTTIEVNGKRVRGRQYPWGVAEGEGSKVTCSKMIQCENSVTVNVICSL